MSFERNIKRDCLFYTKFNDIGNTKIDLCSFKGDGMFNLEPATCTDCKTYVPLDALKCKYRKKLSGGKGDYAVGDILRFDGTRWRVFGKDTLNDGRTRWKLFGENGEEYRIYTDAIPADLEFLGHKDLSFD